MNVGQTQVTTSTIDESWEQHAEPIVETTTRPQQGKECHGWMPHLWHSVSSCPVNVPDHSKGKSYGRDGGNGFQQLSTVIQGPWQEGQRFWLQIVWLMERKQGKGYSGKSYGKEGKSKYYAEIRSTKDIHGHVALSTSAMSRRTSFSLQPRSHKPCWHRPLSTEWILEKTFWVTSEQDLLQPTMQRTVNNNSLFLNGCRSNATHHSVKVKSGVACSLIQARHLVSLDQKHYGTSWKLANMKNAFHGRRSGTI